MQFWTVGVTSVPSWLETIESWVIWLDPQGNAYFQNGEASILVPKGETIMFDGENLIIEGYQA